MPPGRVALSYRPDGSWSCTRDGVTAPCGECDSCRQVQAGNMPAQTEQQDGGLKVSEDAKGGYAVPRQLAGRVLRRK